MKISSLRFLREALQKNKKCSIFGIAYGEEIGVEI